MNATEKNANIDALKTRLANAQSLVLADFRGLTVESDNKLRREFRAVGCEYQVVKNTLLGKAVKGTAMEVLEPLLAGPTAIAFSSEDPAAPAKVATKVARAESKFVIKGGFLDGKLLDGKGRRGALGAARQRRGSRDVPCNPARRASELPAAAGCGPAELCSFAGRARRRAQERRTEVAGTTGRPSFTNTISETQKETSIWPM